MPDTVSLDIETSSIPTLPEVVQRLGSLLDDPSVGLAEVSQVLAEDAALTARLLRLANSAATGLRTPVMSVEHAATALGTRAIRNLAMQASVMSMFAHLPRTPDLDLKIAWKHAALTAQVAQLLARACGGRLPLRPEEYYTCGLVHDLGKLVLADQLGERYLAILRRAREQRRPAHHCERDELGLDHIEVGGAVAARWGLPEAVCNAIRQHHGPTDSIRANPDVAVVGLADQLCYRVQCGDRATISDRLVPLAGTLLGLGSQAFLPVADFALAAWPDLEL